MSQTRAAPSQGCDRSLRNDQQVMLQRPINVDLVILTLTMRINASQLRISVHNDALHRHLPTFTTLLVPRAMNDRYGKVARTIPLLSNLLNPADANTLANAMLQPALGGDTTDEAWDPARQQRINHS